MQPCMNSDLGELLIDWWWALQDLAKDPKFSAYAEDVAGELIVRFIRRQRSGRPVPRFSRALLLKFRSQVFRMVKEMARGQDPADREWEDIQDPCQRDEEESIDRDRWNRLGEFFTGVQIEGMLAIARAGGESKRDYAVGAGVSERTFRSRLRELKDSS